MDRLISNEKAEEFFKAKHAPTIESILFGAAGTLVMIPHCASFLPATFLCAASFAFFAFSSWSFGDVSKHPFCLFCLFLMLAEKYAAHSGILLFEIFQLDMHNFFNISFTTHSLLQIITFAFLLLFPFVKNDLGLQKTFKMSDVKCDFAKISIISFWFQTTFIMAKYVPSYYSLAISTFQIALLIFVFPLAYAWFLFIIFKFIYSILGLQNVTFIIVIFATALLLFKFSTFVQKNFRSVLNKTSPLPSHVVLVLLLALAATFTTPLINKSIKTETAPQVSIEQFSANCLKVELSAADQLSCRQLKGFVVEFEASVESTSISAVINKVRAGTLFSVLLILVYVFFLSFDLELHFFKLCI